MSFSFLDECPTYFGKYGHLINDIFLKMLEIDSKICHDLKEKTSAKPAHFLPWAGEKMVLAF